MNTKNFLLPVDKSYRRNTDGIRVIGRDMDQSHSAILISLSGSFVEENILTTSVERQDVEFDLGW